MELHTRMDALVYVYHEGQSLLPDSTSKISLKTKKKYYIELLYDLTYSIPTKTYENKQTCRQYNKHSFDYCLTNVRPYLDTKIF